MAYVQHLSVRVPWHDSVLDGTVCRYPQSNSSCILLKNIGDKRGDLFEIANAGESMAELDLKRMPCIVERATFMSPRDHQSQLTHPYGFNEALQNIAPGTRPLGARHAVLLAQQRLRR